MLLLSTSAAAAAQNAALTADWSIRTLAATLEAAIEATEGVGTDVVTIVTAVQADVENQELQMKALLQSNMKYVANPDFAYLCSCQKNSSNSIGHVSLS